MGGNGGGTRAPWALRGGTAVVAIFALGCGEGTGSPGGDSVGGRLSGLIPVPGSFLDRSSSRAKGLLAPVDDRGYPVLAGAEMDPMIEETRRFYDRLGRPATVGSVGTPETAPLTFEAWRNTFGFPSRTAGETLDEWRARAHVVVYYNQYELGLGRELGCSEFSDGLDSNGSPQMGLACFVTNYGAAFADQHNSLLLAVEGEHPKNTVCISYRPSLGDGYEVQFYVYGHDGGRQDWAQLDTMGPRPHPQVCTNCHGGSYDTEQHLVKRGRFLPMDPAVMRFASSPAQVTQAAQEESIRIMNALALKTPLTARQREQFVGLYDGQPDLPGQVAKSWVPPAWSDTVEHADLYLRAVKPACDTCHLAMDRHAGDEPSAFHQALNSPISFADSAMFPFVCIFQMPNAQATMNAFWRPNAVMIGGREYGSMAAAMLTAFGDGSGSCAALPRVADCRLASNPDAACGNSHSGLACDRVVGKCVPQLGPDAPLSPSLPNGVCRMDGSRGCGPLSECRPMSTSVAGYDGGCFLCGALGQPACGA